MGKMGKYQIKLTKTYSKVLAVTARSLEDAIELVQAQATDGWLNIETHIDSAVKVKIEEIKGDCDETQS